MIRLNPAISLAGIWNGALALDSPARTNALLRGLRRISSGIVSSSTTLLYEGTFLDKHNFGEFGKDLPAAWKPGFHRRCFCENDPPSGDPDRWLETWFPPITIAPPERLPMLQLPTAPPDRQTRHMHPRLSYRSLRNPRTSARRRSSRIQQQCCWSRWSSGSRPAT